MCHDHNAVFFIEKETERLICCCKQVTNVSQMSLMGSGGGGMKKLRHMSVISVSKKGTWHRTVFKRTAVIVILRVVPYPRGRGP